MANGFIRRCACVAALIGLGVASAPPMDAAPAMAVAATTGGSPVAHAITANRVVPRETGRGWGSMIACAACAVGAGVVIAGGPGAILLAVNAPGSAVALFACAASCYEAF